MIKKETKFVSWFEIDKHRRLSFKLLMDFTPAVVAHTLKDASNWWQDVNQSPLWQDRIFHVLAAIYSLVAAAALVNLHSMKFKLHLKFLGFYYDF